MSLFSVLESLGDENLPVVGNFLRTLADGLVDCVGHVGDVSVGAHGVLPAGGHGPLPHGRRGRTLQDRSLSGVITLI